MPYHLLKQDESPGLWQAMHVDGIALDALRAGLPVAAPAGPVRVTVSALSPRRSDLVDAPCLIVSNALRRALDHAGVDNVEYFPAHVEVEYGTDGLFTNYWVANVLGAVACAVAPTGSRHDGESAASDSPAWGPAGADGDEPAEAPLAFAIDPERALGFDLFRLAEDRRLLVVSERVAVALRAAGLHGVTLEAR